MGQGNSQISSQLPQFGMSQYQANASTDQYSYNYVSPNNVSNSGSMQYGETLAQNTSWQPQNMDPAQSQYDVDILSDNSNHNAFDYTNYFGYDL
jgi:hypothetical protein